MIHQKRQKKFGRTLGQRQAFLRGLLNNLIKNEKIETTHARAQAIRPEIEKMVTLAKKQNVASLRLLIARLGDKKNALKLYYDIAPRYNERKGGYTRIIKTMRRRVGDASARSIVEFV